MSAPETNVEKQKKRHYGPLLGMIAIGAGAILVMLTLTYLSDDVTDEGVTGTIPENSATVEGS
ncbi:hypothetical protein [Neptunicoccus cionae]|uniref:Uncharacterized protein n=1 Tax=Neptunicoccus cionae TaxID=2035344 RepID=A0A916R208_9RHOB|nr:hypothetical protein [Amylibacter cionae]GGA28168.1 hypothetical protein GCM10011498_31550 [Amylibacter cionae]